MRFSADESGQSLVEFALTASLVLMAMFGIIDCSRALYAYHFVSYAARDATRYAMVRGSTWGSSTCGSTAIFQCKASSANIQSFVQSITPLGIDSGTPLTVTTTWPGTGPSGAAGSCGTTAGNNSPGCMVAVKVSYSFNYVLPYLPSTTLALTSTSKVVIAQ
jgi:Flp pilus assembly protein TadG